jgi:peptidoglycan hydrolase-like protein with peptidoglycan-binding domain
LKIDGLAGQETRLAIERFEREQKIPVTGELGPRTLRELSARSGMAIE